MPVVVENRKLYRQPGSGSIRANRSHFAAADLQYLYVPQHGLLRNLVGANEILAPATSAAKFQPSVAGWSATSDATDSRFALSSPPRVTALNRDVTMLWTGVVHGAAAGGNILLFGQTYGTAASAPFTTIALSRVGTANQDQLGMFSNDGASGFINWEVNCSLSSHYGRVVTFAASQVAGTAGLNAVFVTPTSTTTFTNVNNAQSGNAGNPRASSASDVFLFGGIPSDTTRHPNASAALAAAWSRALTLEQLVRLAQDPWSVVQGSRVVVPFGLGGAGSYSDTLTDSGSAGDTVAGSIAAQAAVSDAAAAGEALTGAVVARPLSGFTLLFSGLLRPGSSTLTTSELADALAAADTVASQVTLLGALSDALAAGEVVLVNGTFQAAASDSAAAGDTLSAIGTLQAAMADSAAASDTVVSASVLVSLLSESATADDAVTGGVALISLVSDSAAAADTVVSSSAYASAITDSVSATDAVSAAAALLGALAETITAADAATASAQLQAAIADALVAADLPIAVLSGLGTITESVVLADGASASATLNVTLSDAVTPGDAVTAPSAATYQINVSVAWAAPAGERIWSAPSRSRTWAAPSTPRVWH